MKALYIIKMEADTFSTDGPYDSEEERLECVKTLTKHSDKHDLNYQYGKLDIEMEDGEIGVEADNFTIGELDN